MKNKIINLVNIMIMTKNFITSLLMTMFFIACQNEPLINNSKNEIDNSNLIGYYHNEILKNFIAYNNQTTQKGRSNSDDFVQIMANYGVSVLTAFKNNPPNESLDQWVEQILNVSLDPTQTKMVNLINNGTPMVNAVNIVFANSTISATIRSYLIELNSTITQYCDSPSFQNKIDLLQRTYSQTASQEDKTIISWTTDLAKGSQNYWKQEYSKWSPSLLGRFWDSGKLILKADAIGGLEYILGTKIGIIGGPISWKIGAAYAALNSILSGTDLLLKNGTSRNPLLSDSNNVTREEVYNAYLKRKAELKLN